MSEKDNLKKLNIGCGLRTVPGFDHLDIVDGPNIDIHYDLNSGKQMRWKNGREVGGTFYMTVPDNYYDRLAMIHVFEHVQNVIPMMTELYRVAKPGAELVIVTPYGSSDNADEDPTHVRRVFKDSYIYYTPLAYGKADYGVTCDWDYRRRKFLLDKAYFSQFGQMDEIQMGMIVATMRNVVKEFTAVLVAQKPARKIGEAEDPKPPFTEFKIA